MTIIDPSSPVDSWLVDRIKCLCKLGFFQRSSHLDVAELLTTPEMDELRCGLHYNPKLLDEDYAEFWVLSRDHDRIFSFDLETDDHEGDDLYIDLVNQICHISRGQLLLANVTESWQQVGDREYRIKISFQQGEESFETIERHSCDWAGVANLFGLLDELLFSQGARLWYVKNVNQAVHMVVMTPGERTSLEANTSLRFEPACPTLLS